MTDTIDHLPGDIEKMDPAANYFTLDLLNADITQLQGVLAKGLVTSAELVKRYLKRIEKVNKHGPELNAVIEINPDAIDIAQQLDNERESNMIRGRLHGIPVLVKDNIATLDQMETTSGSFALVGAKVPRDAHVVTLLRNAGAIIIGKTNLSEWSHYRSDELPSGWSARGGQTKSPYVKDGDPAGSSSGSAVATAIGLATVSLGTETDGSIICPSSRNAIVGLKPTVGLTSRCGVIPISHTQDTVGPMTRSVLDTAILLTVIAGRDDRDPATTNNVAVVHEDYTRFLEIDGLKGARLGVPRKLFVNNPKAKEMTPTVLSEFENALEIIKSLGAEIIDPADLPSTDELSVSRNESTVFAHDFKYDLALYLAELTDSRVHSVADVVAFNLANPNLEMPPGKHHQDLLEYSARAGNIDAPEYLAALRANHELGRTRGIDAVLTKHNLDALVLPAGEFATGPPAIAGYPIITVPLGYEDGGGGLPFGLAFMGTAWSEGTLLRFAYAFEQATMVRLKILPRFRP